MNVKQKPEYFDVIIVGAGISGIGSAYHMHDQCAGKSFLILEEMESFGGTWLTHKYPGVRSDSDLYTFGYRFKPWTRAPIASGEEILHYLGEVIFENDLDRHIRYHHHIDSANWSGKDKLWTLECIRKDTDEPLRFTTSFLWMCQGYYQHAKGYTPEWDGMQNFQGQIVHPVLSGAEKEKLLNAALKDSNTRIWLFVMMGLNTGLRHSEILSARFENLPT